MRYYSNKKTTAEECHRISIFWLKKHNYLSGRSSGGIKWSNNWNEKENSVNFVVNTLLEYKYIEFRYTITDNNTLETEKCQSEFRIKTTKCNYGGVRYWFICNRCQKRKGVLYFKSKHFACNECHNLSYESKNLNRYGYYSLLAKNSNIKRDIEKLKEKIKIKYRKGKPTKNYKKLMEKEKIFEEIFRNFF